MFDKNIFGYLSLFFTLLSGVPYIHSILTGKTKPHIFTHLLWGVMTSIAAAAQYAAHAGAGAWGSALGAVFCFVNFSLSFKYGERTITRSDCVSFGIGLCAIPLWYFTDNPLLAIILVTMIDVSAYYPTFRKSFVRPHEEMIFSYVISNLKHVMAILAMEQYSVTTLFYPVFLFSINCALISMLVLRRSGKT